MTGATDWLSFAAEDLQVAELALAAHLYNQVCFHAQQCTEKALKAWLVHHSQPAPRVHQMGPLLGLCPRPLPFPPALEMEILTLDRFYIPTRYPDALPGALPHGLPTELDAQDALATARQVWEAINGSV